MTRPDRFLRVRSSTLLSSTLLSVLLLGACAGGDDDDDDESFFEPPGDTHGASLGEWAGRWWQWAFAIPADDNPVLDGDCDVGQSGDVFLLAGNTGGMSTRDCTVPAGKAIFFPVANFVCFAAVELATPPCEQYYTEKALTTCAASAFDGADITLSATLDGEELTDAEAYRAHSGLFTFAAPADPDDQLFPPYLGAVPPNECGVPEGDRPGVADGYWVMLRPLPPGEHELHFSVNLLSQGDTEPFVLDVTYNLTQE
jgi:hypothetical protein